MASTREKLGLTSEEYVKRFCVGQAWNAYKRSAYMKELDPIDAMLPKSEPDLLAARFRVLALNVLALGKYCEDPESWSRSQFCVFWCLIADIDHKEYVTAVEKREGRRMVSRHMRSAA